MSTRSILAMLLTSLGAALQGCQSPVENGGHDANAVFKLTSPTLKPGGVVPQKHWFNQFGCTGGNISPALSWSGAPAGTKSFAITVYDQDAPTGSGFWHWVAYDIPADINGIAEGAAAGKLPSGVSEGKTDLGVPGWSGACPVDGREHRYVYTVYALGAAKLEIAAGTTPAYASFVFRQNAIAKSTLEVKAGTNQATARQEPAFQLASATLKANAEIPKRHWFNQFGCTGENISPALAWSGAPAGTKSFAITVYDQDAPTGSGFWHWIAYDIPANVISLAEGATADKLPVGTRQGNTDLGAPGWFGACPVDGLAHRYTYTVMALDIEKAEVPEGATAAFTNFILSQHSIAKGELSGMAGGD